MVKKKNTDKVPSGTSEAIKHGTNQTISDGNDPFSDQDGGGLPPEELGRHSLMPKGKSRKGSEEFTPRGTAQTPNPNPGYESPGTDGNLPQALGNRSRLRSADPSTDLSVINEMLDTIFKYTEELESLRNMSSKAALLLEETRGPFKLQDC